MIEKDTILLLVLSKVSILDLSGLSLNKLAQKREKNLIKSVLGESGFKHIRIVMNKEPSPT